MDVVEFERESEKNKELGVLEKVINGGLAISRAKSIIVEFKKQSQQRSERKPIKLRTSFTKDDVTVYNKSSNDMSEVKSESVQVVFTSPPYYNLRNYGNSVNGQPELGHETTPQQFVINLSTHLKDVYRVLKNTGSFFLNIGESCTNGHNLLIPNRLVLHLCENEGYFLVNEIIWRKTNPIPQASNRKLQPTYEKIFHLVKDPTRYYYEEFKMWNDNEMQLKKAPADRNVKSAGRKESGIMLTRSFQKFKDFIEEQTVKNVITGTNGATRQCELKQIDNSIDHPALMPDYLPIIPILTTSKPGDIILDPFSGSGTTGKVALLLGRKYIGYELNKENFELSELDLNKALNEKAAAGVCLGLN